MRKRKLKAFVLPSIYLLIIGAIFVGVGFMNESLNTKKSSQEKVVSTIIEEVQPVISDVEKNITPTIPYKGENVNILKNYYSKDDEEKTQEESLIQYENTYLENTGILYGSETSFEIIATLDGTVTNIKEDEFLGKVIEIKHSNNLTTYYYSLNEIKVNTNDEVKAGDIIATSGTNKINSSNNSLLFEVYVKGKTIDPKRFYDMEVSTLNQD